MDPGTRTDTYLYDLNGNLAKWTNRRGQVITFAYDAVDRLTARYAPGDTSTFVLVPTDSFVVGVNRSSRDSLVFDTGGRLVNAVSTRGSTPVSYNLEYQYTIDRKSQVSLVTPFTPAPTVIWQYLENGQLRRLIDAANLNTTFLYNADLQLDTVLFGDTTVIGSIAYPSSHRESSILYNQSVPNAVAGRLIQQDSLGRVVAAWHSAKDTFRVFKFDTSGRLWRMLLNETFTSSTCDSTDFGFGCQVADTTNIRFSEYFYDKVGNSNNTGEVIEAGNRLVISKGEFGGTDTLSYDADGNLELRRFRSSGGVPRRQEFFWNGLSQLDSAKLYHDTILIGLGRYRYDAWGRRNWKFSSGDSLRFILDGHNIFAEIDSTLTLTATYAYAPGSYSPHAMTRAGSSYYYLYDEAQNVTGLMKYDGTVPNHYRCGPWGFSVCQLVEGVKNPFGFKGQYQDAETGLVYKRERYYSGTHRRFISEDPLGLAGGINQYTFAGNDPINSSDPLGLQPDMRCHSHVQERLDDPSTSAIELPILTTHCVRTNPFSDRFGNRDFMSGLGEFGSNVLAGASAWGSRDRVNTGPGFRTGVLLGLAGFFLPAVGGAGFQVSFQTTHAARHLTGSGLTAASVEAAIRAQVLSDLSRASLVGRSFWGRVQVQGQLIEYRAFQHAPGRISIGTYYFPRFYQ